MNSAISTVKNTTRQALYIALITAAFFGLATPALAANPFGDRDMEGTVDLGNAYRLPGVFAVDLKIQNIDSKNITGSFTAWNNEEDIMAGLQYNIEIWGKNDGLLYARKPVYDQFYLTSKEQRQMEFSYELPKLPNGNYILRIQMDTNSGRLLGWADADLQITKSSNDFVKIVPTAIALPGISEDIADILAGPNVNKEETFTLKAELQNKSTKTLQVTPVLDIYNFDIARGQAVSTNIAAITLKPGVTDNIEFPVTAPKKAGVYSGYIYLLDNSGSIISSLAEYRFVVRGLSADIMPPRFTVLTTIKGEKIVMKLDLVGAPDAESKVTAKVKVEITDEKGVAGKASINGIDLGQSVTQTIARVELTRNLSGPPTITTTVSSTDNQELAKNSIYLDIPKGQFVAPGNILNINNILFSIGAIIAIVLMYFLFMNAKKNHMNIPNKTLVLMAVAVMAIAFAGTTALAAGNGNGIEVITPISASVYHVNTGEASIALFINAPIHDAAVGTYQKTAVPFQYKVTYAVCANRISFARVLVRYDLNGGKQSTYAGSNANWSSIIYDQTFQAGPTCPGGAAGCMASNDSVSTTLNLSGLNSSATSTTLQVIAKLGQDTNGCPSGCDPHHPAPPDTNLNPTTDNSFFWPVVHAVNLWLNFQAQAPIVCSSNSQCGTNGLTGSPFCSNNTVIQNFRTWTCNNPGTASSSCSSSDAPVQQTICTNNQTCSGGTCVNNQLPQCSDGIDNDGDNLIDFPNDPGCTNAQDTTEFNAPITCSTNSQCGTSGLTGSLYCSGNGVYQIYTTYTCNNPGTVFSVCSNTAVPQLQQTCTGNQTCSGNTCVNQPITCSSNSQCGTSGLVGGPFCQGNGVYQNYTTYTCNNPGTAFSTCSNNTAPQLQQTCSGNQTCSGSSCITTGTVTCSTNSQCGTNGIVGSAFCTGNGVYNNYITYTCNNPGTTNSYCSNSTAQQLQTNCSNNQTCSGGACITTGTVVCSTNSQCGTNGTTGSAFCSGNGVYQNFTTYTCNNPGTTSSYCSNTTNQQLQQTCNGSQTCSSGSCVNTGTVVCSSNSQCGTSGLTGSSFCSGNGVYQNFTTYTCNNPGTTSSYCSNSSTQQLQQTCLGNQTCSGNTCVTNNTCTSHASLRCTGSNAVYWFDSCGNQQELYQACTGNQTCSGNTCVTTATTTGNFVTKQVRNLSTGNLTWTSSVASTPGDILQFQISVRNSGTLTINNVIVKDTFPSNLYYNNSLTLDGVTNTGNIISGFDIGSILPSGVRTIAYQAQVAPAQNFAFGTTTLTNSATATSTSPIANYGISSAATVVNRTGVQGATTVSTGLTNNFFVDSFFLPLLLVLAGVWAWRSGLLNNLGFAGFSQRVSQNKLAAKIAEIKSREVR